MSINEIMDWIGSHDQQSKREDYFERGSKTQHIIRYENGDTYQHIEIYDGIMKKKTETIINNKTVCKKELVYRCFGWYEKEGAIK